LRKKSVQFTYLSTMPVFQKIILNSLELFEFSIGSFEWTFKFLVRCLLW
jgi:hypothetical protein